MTAKEILGVAVFGAFCLFSEFVDACAYESWLSVKKAGLRITTMPSVVIGERPSYRAGVITLTNTWDCRVYLHELVHHVQWLQFGDAKSEAEWWRRERDAAIVTERIWE